MEKSKKEQKTEMINKSGKKTNAKKGKGGFSFLGFGKGRDVKVVRYREGVDRLYLILVILLLAIGTVMISSASYADALHEFGDSYHYTKRQILMASIGIISMGVVANFIDYRLIQKLSGIFFVGVLALNYITPFFGKMTNGATRWFTIAGIQFQPSELLKVAIVLLFANYIVTVGDNIKTFKWGLAFPGLILLAVAGAMYFQSHFSGLIIIMGIGLVMIFIAGAPIKWLGLFGGSAAAVLTYIILFTPYAQNRINSWLRPEEYSTTAGWQILQSLYAIGSGGLFGVGLGQSRQKFLYLPEPQNDFIFSIICEETGFLGAMMIILIFVLLIWRGFVIAFHAPDKFSSLVVLGITVKVAIQTLLNIAVVTNSIPNTGISLPFFSYGGTALIILLAEMGIVLSISRYSYQDKG